MRLLPLCIGLLFAAPAFASSSTWHETEGGRVRLITVGEPDANGQLNGMLDIQLDPGWKTYWREPGDAGVPPTLELNGGSAQILYPAPEWDHDGTYDWAGYSSSVVLPVMLTVPPEHSGALQATAFLGLCKTICIPLKADFTLDPASDPDNPSDSLALAGAQAQLPEAASAAFGVTNIQVNGEQATFSITGYSGADAELFLAGSDGFAFSRPKPVVQNGKLFFTAKVTSYLKAKPKSATVFYTLKTPARAASGTLPF
ncbi:MAG: protein-disulfide reductase DsbD family protein [Mesorhizobium sp.]